MNGCLKTLVIVGYTNVGESSLFSRLTKAGVLMKDQLFAALDTTAHRLFLSHRASVILTGAVDFVHDLPYKLVSAFSVTLEEIAMADVLLHVVNVPNPDFEQQMDNVGEILEGISTHEIPQLAVYNKIDLLPPGIHEVGIPCDNSEQVVGVNISVAESLGSDGLRETMIELAVQPNT